MADNDQPAAPAAPTTPAAPAASVATPPADTTISPAAAPDKAAMTAVEAPPLAPAAAPEVEAGAPTVPTPSPAPRFAWPLLTWPLLTWPSLAWPSLTLPALSRRARRRAALAATIALAAGIGGTIGALAIGASTSPPPAPVQDTAAAQEREAMQKTIARLGKEITTLRANLDSAGKTATAQIAKLTERNDKLSEKLAAVERRAAAAAASPETTGSIAAAVPLPAPKPDQKSSAAKPPAVAEQKPPVIEGWTIRSARDGMVLVEGRGEIYEVVPGAPLPGLGRVEAIERRDGRWVVVTPKGLIVAMRPLPRPLYGAY